MTTFSAVATRSTRLRVIFSEPMQKNAALLNRTQYTVNDISGANLSVLSVSAEQATAVLSTVLDLGSPLVGGRTYQLRVTASLVSESGAAVSPNITAFRWVEGTLRAQIPLSAFSGEARGGLFGDGAGVFFSPALEMAVPNSAIQVDQVDVCTRAYDEYRIPGQLENQRPLMAHAARSDGSLWPTPLTTLNSTVLWQPTSRVDTRFAVGMRRSEQFASATDGPATATLVSWPPGRIALLNNPGWKLFDNQGGGAPYLITADNLTPILLGAPVTRTL